MNTNTKHWAGITAGILSLAGYASAANLGSEKYTYDASGNIVEKSIDGQVTKMTYDASNRLTERQAAGQSEITAYDAAERPIDMKDGTGQSTHSMSYGYGDKVLETKNHGTNTDFFYNAEGQLVGKKTDSGVSTYTWDGNVLAADAAAAFANEAHICGGIPVLSSQKDVVISDYLGNSLMLGIESFKSTPFAEGLEKGRLNGKPFIQELGGYIFHHRTYDLKINRWTTKDPSGYPNGGNSFEFVGSNPKSNIDQSGLSWTDWIDLNPSPGVPPSLIDTFAAPSAQGHYGDIGTTDGKKWQHQSWSDINNYNIYTDPGQTITGGFTMIESQTASYTIGAVSLTGSVSFTTSQGGNLMKTYVCTSTERKKANLKVSKADIYNMRQSFLCDSSNKWNAIYSPQWVSNEKIGNLYRNHVGIHEWVQNEQ